MESFHALGARIDRDWRATGRDEERFPDIAANALAAHPLGGFDREGFLDAWLDPASPTGLQLAPPCAFGQPGTTVHHGDGFAIEVYYWLNSRSAIHNHPFCGVFTLLEGWSVHARYRVTEREHLGGGALRADGALDGLDLFRPGQVQRFSLHAHPLVHALVHVPIPSLSLVVRTIRSEGYLRYLPPSLALPMEGAREPAERRIALLESLRAAGDARYRERFERELAGADFACAVQLLSSGWSEREPGERAELLELLRPLHGDRVDLVPPALDQAARVAEASAIREGLTDPDLRLVATALAYGDSRQRVLDLLAQRGDANALLRRFVDEAGLFDAGNDTPLTIVRALVDGEDPLRRLAARYGTDAVEPFADDVRRTCSASIFAVLGAG